MSAVIAEPKQLPRSIAHMGRLKDADPQEVLAQYLALKPTPEIAASFGVTRAALNLWLIEHHVETWKLAQVAKAITRKEDAEDEINGSTDALTLARAREKLKSAQWDLERVCRRIYGDVAQAPVSAEQLGELLMAISTRMLTERQVNSVPAERVIDATNA